MMTKIIHNIIIDKQTKLSKKAQNAGDVESNMSPQVAGREVLCVMRVIKRVTYPHNVRITKISALKETNRTVRVQEKEQAKTRETVRAVAEQIGLMRVEVKKACERCGKYHQRGQSCNAQNLIRLRQKWQKQ